VLGGGWAKRWCWRKATHCGNFLPLSQRERVRSLAGDSRWANRPITGRDVSSSGAHQFLVVEHASVCLVPVASCRAMDWIALTTRRRCRRSSRYTRQGSVRPRFGSWHHGVVAASSRRKYSPFSWAKASLRETSCPPQRIAAAP
jgi:hypothetical protein